MGNRCWDYMSLMEHFIAKQLGITGLEIEKEMHEWSMDEWRSSQKWSADGIILN